MKKLLLIIALLVGAASSYDTIEAQGVSINVNINIGRQPAWGPEGYDYVDYYYFPDMNCYYNVNLELFYYFMNGGWISARYLPYAYRHYDLYGMYKVVFVGLVNPWEYNFVHVKDYARYKGHKRTQVVIRDSRDIRYKDSRNNKVRWYAKDSKTNHINRNNASVHNDRSNASVHNNRSNASVHNNRGNASVHNNRDNASVHNNRGNASVHNNNINHRNNNSGNGNRDNKNIADNTNSNNRNNNSVKKDSNTKQYDNKGNRQSQRNSDNQSFSGRSNRDKKESAVARSGSSGRSQENRMASNGERRSGRNR